MTQQQQHQQQQPGQTTPDQPADQQQQWRQQQPPNKVSFPPEDAIAVVHHLPPSSSSAAGSSTSCACPSNSNHTSTGYWARFKAAVKQLKRDVLALYYAVHDERTPLLSKLLPWLVLAYALSPLDLIPDFIPVLGFLDDMLLLPLGLWLSYKLIPAEVMEASRARAAAEPLLLHKNYVVATLVAALWCASLLLLEHWLILQYGTPQLKQLEWAVLGGSGGVAVLVFVVWAVLRVRHERRRREAAAGSGAALLAAYDSSDEEEEDCEPPV